MLSSGGIKIVMLVVLSGWTFYTLVPRHMDYSSTRNDLSQIEAALLAEQKAHEDLRIDIHRLKTDPRAVEQVARDKFGLCREGEKVYDFGDSQR
jgi:cell division protein FtsB